MTESAESMVERLQADVDSIEGLISLMAAEKRVLAIVEAASMVSAVRASLTECGVPREVLEVIIVTEHLIPHPNDDRRLMEWIERSGRS